MYVADCDGRKTASESVYRKVFTNDFDLKFQMPKKDTCIRCDTYKTKISAVKDEADEDRKQLELEQNIHHEKAKDAREQLQADRQRSKEVASNCHVITFDLQGTLPTPRLSTNIVYYKRQLMVYSI